MSEISVSTVTDLSDKYLKNVCERVLKTMQLATEKAIAHHADAAHFPLANAPNSLEQIMLGSFRKLKADKQQAAITSVMASINSNTAERLATYGDLANINLRVANPVEVQANALPFPPALKFPANHLKNLINTPTIFITASFTRPTVAPAQAVRNASTLGIRAGGGLSQQFISVNTYIRYVRQSPSFAFSI